MAKLAGEGYCRSFSEVYGLETVALRYFNVFGPRQDPQSQYAAVIPNFITATLRGEPVTVFGDGEQSRDFTYVDNVVEANMLAMAAPDVAGASTTSPAASASASTSCSPRSARSSAGLPRCATRPRDAGTSSTRWPTSRRARDELGYRVDVSFEEGLRQTVQHYVSSEQASLVES